MSCPPPHIKLCSITPNMPLEPPENLPIEGFEALDSLLSFVNASAKQQGYAIVKQRSTNYKDGVPRRVDLVCEFGGTPKPHRGTGLRNASTRKTECPWKAKALLRAGTDPKRWFFELQDAAHNHEPSAHPSVHPTHRKRTWTEAQSAEIQDYLQLAPGAREITALLRKRYPDQVWDRRDIYNERLKARGNELDIYTPTQALIRQLQEANFKHTVLYDEENRLRAVFWSLPWCERQWERFPDIVSLDNTYKTNRFRMPFLNITGITNINTTFCIAFALVSAEDEEAYL